MKKEANILIYSYELELLAFFCKNYKNPYVLI